nr:immunoglobulin light chain junction region [Macaca mulatta]MPN68733.1 immunoglobulin light chain junction region [Macaca mulatta]MPN68789.1 immunoglobulin light chain junction region [Macaca mulatta]
WAIGHSSGDVF